MRPPTKLQVFANFWPQIIFTILYHPPPVLSRFISARLFSGKLKELHFADVAGIQEAVTDELKKVQKQEFSAAFQKLHDRAKACANGDYFEFKKVCLRLKKNPS
jgi:hypothetical protein